MDQLPIQLGVGGIFAVLVIREVLGFLTKRKTNGYNNEILATSIKYYVGPVLEKQVAILDELKTTATRQTEILLKLQYVGDELKEGQGSMLASLHEIGASAQEMNLRLGRPAAGV